MSAERRSTDRPPTDRSFVAMQLSSSCDRACLFCNTNSRRWGRERSPLVALVQHHRSPLRVLGRISGDLAARVSEWTAVEERLYTLQREQPQARLSWSGNDVTASPLFRRALELAYDLGFRDMSVQTPGTLLADPAFADFLAAHGVTSASLTAHGSTPETFDAMNGRVGGHRLFWDSVENLLARGFALFVAVPCTRASVEDLPALLLQLAQYPLRVQVFLWFPDDGFEAGHALIGCSATEATRSLSRAADELDPRRIGVTGIPRCAVPDGLGDKLAFSFERTHHSASLPYTYGPDCAACAMRSECVGMPEVYWRTFDDLRPVDDLRSANR